MSFLCVIYKGVNTPALNSQTFFHLLGPTLGTRFSDVLSPLCPTITDQHLGAVYKNGRMEMLMWNVNVRYFFAWLLLSEVTNCKWKQWMDQTKRTFCFKQFLFISSIHFMACDHHSRYAPLGVFIKWQFIFYLLVRRFLMSRHVTSFPADVL